MKSNTKSKGNLDVSWKLFIVLSSDQEKMDVHE